MSGPRSMILQKLSDSCIDFKTLEQSLNRAGVLRMPCPWPYLIPAREILSQEGVLENALPRVPEPVLWAVRLWARKLQALSCLLPQCCADLSLAPDTVLGARGCDEAKDELPVLCSSRWCGHMPQGGSEDPLFKKKIRGEICIACN